MNILVPLAGNNLLKENVIVPLVTINHKTVIEHVLDNLKFDDDDKFIFVLNEKDCDKFYIDSVLRLLKPESQIIKVKNKTQGQLCSCLLALEHINKDEPLLIVNGDQYLFENVNDIIKKFKQLDADGGIVTFNSIHPKWSYVLLDKDNLTVIETSEKRPISHNACVGMYYFKRGSLANRKVVALKVSNDNFFALDSEETISFFLSKINGAT